MEGINFLYNKKLPMVSFAQAYIFCVLLIAIILGTLIHQFELGETGLWLYAVSPALIAIAFALFDQKRPLKSLGWRFSLRGCLEATSILIAITLIVLLFAYLHGDLQIQGVSLYKFLRSKVLVAFLIGILMNLGEELGWRGYLFPKLFDEIGWWQSTYIVGLVWWIWHLPLMVILQVSQTNSIEWLLLAKLLLVTMALSVFFNLWLIRFASVWVIAFAHQLVNFINKWFLGLAHSNKEPIFFANRSYADIYSLENGWLGILVLIASAVVFYYGNRKRICWV